MKANKNIKVKTRIRVAIRMSHLTIVKKRLPLPLSSKPKINKMASKKMSMKIKKSAMKRMATRLVKKK